MATLDDPLPVSAAGAPHVVRLDSDLEGDLVHLADEIGQWGAGRPDLVLDLTEAGAIDQSALSSFFARLAAQQLGIPVPAACPDPQVQQLVRRCGSAESGVVLFASVEEARAAAGP